LLIFKEKEHPNAGCVTIKSLPVTFEMMKAMRMDRFASGEAIPRWPTKPSPRH